MSTSESQYSRLNAQHSRSKRITAFTLVEVLIAVNCDENITAKQPPWYCLPSLPVATPQVAYTAVGVSVIL